MGTGSERGSCCCFVKYTHLVHLTTCSVKELYLSSTCWTSGKPNGMVEQIKSFPPDSTDPPLSDEHRENIQRSGRVCHSVSGAKNGEYPCFVSIIFHA